MAIGAFVFVVGLVMFVWVVVEPGIQFGAAVLAGFLMAAGIGVLRIGRIGP